ncbi:staphylokinase domain-containing protein [Staphylococcus aureus]|uniref:staphylokinase domain-containing protein n=1 Tax=Staphylococcus aureus TaxID=1280 RepID=UPI002175B7D8|nr:staphylokinase domain-containing protein [Staphylococcus aureus]MCS5352509.1 hypothetical protein [Staphylococcus aureus]
MKRIRNILKIIVLSIIISPIVFHHDAKATSLPKQDISKSGFDVDYQETPGHHLIVNVTARDTKGNIVSLPHYSEFRLTPNTVLTKDMVKEFIEWNLDGADYKRFKVMDIPSDAKIQVVYDNIDTKERETKIFPITDKGFVIPDLSKHVKNPSFTLVTDVTVVEKPDYQDRINQMNQISDEYLESLIHDAELAVATFEQEKTKEAYEKADKAVFALPDNNEVKKVLRYKINIVLKQEIIK